MIVPAFVSFKQRLERRAMMRNARGAWSEDQRILALVLAG